MASGSETQSSGLFSIFVISMFTLFLVPFTIYRLCAGSDEGEAAQPWLKGKKKNKLGALAQRYMTKGNAVTACLWILWGFMLLWVQASVKEMKPFDPFEILGVDSTSTDRDIKKAYRQLSLKFHPDKNPDPEATKYFTEYITKAYAALTDETSRQNYEKYGHPDGPQAMNVGVALPSWVFAKEKGMAPIMLIILVFCGILLPLIVASWYMLSSNKFTGPNNIMQETLAFYMHSKFNVKESQSLARIPETLVCAMEFIVLPTPSEQEAAIDELRKALLRWQPDLKDKTLFWKRKLSVLKAHMLLLAHLERETDAPVVGTTLQADLKFVLQKSFPLLEEMFKIACLPRPPHGHGWLEPAKAIVEMQQCLAQAMPLSVRKPQGKQADASTLLAQLPQVDQEVIKKLRRRKISTLKELQELSEADRVEALTSTGITSTTAHEDISTMLSILPQVHMRAEFEVEGEEDIMEQDVAKCKVRVILTRPSHASPNFEPPTKGKPVRAYTPLYPHPHEEGWFFILCDPATNSVYGQQKVSLSEAEVDGYKRPELVEEWAAMAAAGTTGADKADGKKDSKPAVGKAAATASKFIKSYAKGGRGSNSALDATAGAADANDDTSAADAGQLVELQFLAPPKAGKYDLQLHAMCDSYVGCDRVLPLRLRVTPLTRAAQENREARLAARQQRDDDSEDGSQASDRGSRKGGSDDEDEEDESEYDYDSEETGELESGSDIDEPVDAKQGKPAALKKAPALDEAPASEAATATQS